MHGNHGATRRTDTNGSRFDPAEGRWWCVPGVIAWGIVVSLLLARAFAH